MSEILVPAAQENIQEAQYQDEWSDRYGILVGGFLCHYWNGIGEHSVGHHEIKRREWLRFNRLRVGRRNEGEGLLDSPPMTVTEQWSINPDRLMWKSPRACAGDVLARFKEQGFCVPAVLTGHPEPEKLIKSVWPRAVRVKRLYQQIQYFEAFQTDDDEEARLASELLNACYISRNYTSEYVRTLKDEFVKKEGLKNLNNELKELFYEVNETLPEHKTAEVAQAMGKEIVQATQGESARSDRMFEAMMAQTAELQEQNRLQAERNRLLEERLNLGPLAQGGNPETKEATPVETSSTSTRRPRAVKE